MKGDAAPTAAPAAEEDDDDVDLFGSDDEFEGLEPLRGEKNNTLHVE